MPFETRYGNDRVFLIFPSSNFSIGKVPIHGLITDALKDITERLYSTAVRIAPEDTGELRTRGIRKFGPTRVNVNTWRAGIGLAKDPEHGIWVHDGTGIYGPRKTRIVPRTAPYLKFRIDDRIFRLKSVRGQPAQPFMDKAFILINRVYIPLRVERLRLLIQAFAQS